MLIRQINDTTISQRVTDRPKAPLSYSRTMPRHHLQTKSLPLMNCSVYIQAINSLTKRAESDSSSLTHCCLQW